MSNSTPLYQFQVGERVRVISDGVLPVHHFKKGAIVTIRVVERGSDTYIAQSLEHSDFSFDFYGWSRPGVGDGLQQMHAYELEPETLFPSIPKIISASTLPFL